ncbi:hypothetical protein V5O48_011532 [Marasmius crinis-equi]|uniref:Cytochrome P450 n=1 Tax=Marasmius crinis-equi TaxID=585013 RepID=A0ABR3F5A8_9AGAR
MAISAAIVIISAISIFYILSRRKRANLPYPPGPKALLFAGSLLEILKIKPWKTYTEWSKTYGSPLLHYRANLQHTIVVNTKELSDQLFEKRARIYSDRPYIPMVDLLGWGTCDVVFMRYNETWRKYRRFFQQGFRPDVSCEYLPIQISKNTLFISSLREDPAQFLAHIKTYVGAAILATLYGYDAARTNDHFVGIAQKSVVNVFPILRHLPLSLPIFKFQKVAAKGQKLTNEMLEVPFQYVRHDMEFNSGKPSLLRKFLELNDADGGDEDQEFAIKGVCGTAYAAGSDTTVASIEAFFLAMGMYPDTQKKAQAELDTVIRGGQMPGYEERSKLPYIEAILRETLRWSPALPLGVLKATSEEDVVDGFYIPKGATVVNNIWAISRDEAIYPGPESFNPERFLKEDGTCDDDDSMFIFGTGRRICPGRHFASATLWLAITSVLVEFDIGKPTTLDRREVQSLEDVNHTDGLSKYA